MTEEQQSGTTPEPETESVAVVEVFEAAPAPSDVADVAVETSPIPSPGRRSRPPGRPSPRPGRRRARVAETAVAEAAAEAAVDAVTEPAVEAVAAAEAAVVEEAAPGATAEEVAAEPVAVEASMAEAAVVEEVAASRSPWRPSRSPRRPSSRRRRSPRRLPPRSRSPATWAPSRRRWRSCSPSRTPTSRASSTATSSRAPIVRIDRDEILVDIGAKSEGVVSNRELYGRNAEAAPTLAVGDTVLVYVLQPESPEGHVVLSLRRAGLERKWRSMQEQFEAGAIIEAPVIDHNKGGLIVDCGIRGFVPISQIVDFPRRPQNEQPRDAAQEIAEKLQPYVGRRLRLKILEVNRKANRLILSEKVALYEERREKRDELFSSLQVGQKVKGTVRSIAPFGVFVDLGGIDGLVHKSELSWNKVNNPEAGYRVGDEVEAEVIDINHERGRISLSIRRLQPDPWHSTVADFRVGDVIDGTVTKLVNFGAFVRVRDGLEGLIHISELLAPAGGPPGRRRPRGPGPQAQDHLARLRAPSPRPEPQAGRGAAGPAGAARAATAARAPGARLLDGRRRPGAGGRDRQHAGRRVRPGAAAARGGRAHRYACRGRGAGRRGLSRVVRETIERGAALRRAPLFVVGRRSEPSAAGPAVGRIRPARLDE